MGAQPGDTEILQAKRAAVRLLGQRARTRSDLHQRLARQGFSAEAIDQALAALARAGYVDDARFAHERIEELLRKSPQWGPALVHRLVSDGVPAELAEQAVAERLAGEDERRWACALARERMRKIRARDVRAARNQLGAYLIRRGFDPEVAAAAVEEVLPETP